MRNNLQPLGKNSNARRTRQTNILANCNDRAHSFVSFVRLFMKETQMNKLHKNINSPQQVFEQMLHLRIPEHFKSDLYHDAMFLSNFWKDVEQKVFREKSSFIFYWVLRPMGTQLGTGKKEVIDIPLKSMQFIGAYLFTLSPGKYDNEMWLRIKRILCPNCISTLYGHEKHECVCLNLLEN